jgi:thiol-disulfide isomerase/thioredoxin
MRSWIAALTAAALLPAVLAAQSHQPAVTVIAGTLLGANGAPMKLAHVHVWRGMSPRGATRSLVGPDGRFAIATQYTGPLMVEFTGVDHNSATVPLMVDRARTIGMDVRLKHYEYTDSLDHITAIGDWNQFGFGAAKPLVKQPDGRYTLEVEATADTLAYELLGLTKEPGHSINGPQAGRYSYDNGGDYKNVIRARDGHATIVLDPASLQRVPGDLRVSFHDPASPVARTWRLMHAWNAEERAYFDSSRAARARHDSLRFDMTPALRRLRAALASERDPLLRQLLLFQLVDATGLAGAADSSACRRLIADVPPSSPWFGLDPNGLNSMYQAFGVAYGTTGPRHQLTDSAQRRLLDRFERIAAAQPDSEIQAEALQSAVFLAKRLHDDQRFNADYMALVTGHPESSATRFVQSQLAPNRALREGVPMPDFHFAALEDSTVAYTPRTFAGKPYVLDFWATTCGPCVYDMKYLHAAHDSLAALGVQLLSVSLDASPQDVARFRAGEWKMPWPQAFAAGAFENPDIKRLEILGIPTMVVVGSDGTIRAVDLGMKGEELLPGVRRALEGHTTP